MYWHHYFTKVLRNFSEILVKQILFEKKKSPVSIEENSEWKLEKFKYQVIKI